MDEKSEIFRVHSHADSDFDSEKIFSMDSDSDSEYFIMTVSDSDTDSENFAIVTSDTDTDSDGVGVTVGVRCHRRALINISLATSFGLLLPIKDFVDPCSYRRSYGEERPQRFFRLLL